MSFKVYDNSRSLMATFATEAEAAKFVYNNDDLAAFINDVRVTAEVHTPVDTPASPAYQAPNPPKLLDAAAALEKIKQAQEATVNSIVEQVIEGQGQADFDLQHPLVIKRLEELGFTVLTFTTTGGDIDAMSVSIPGALT